MPDAIKPGKPGPTEASVPPSERFEAGRARRESVPLAAHAELAGDEARADPLFILGGQDRSRLPEVVPLRYGRMSYTPFTYLRGAAAVMAADLARVPRTDIRVELCGDAHLGNFRWYNAPNREPVFDLNDFDETLPGPFEWDLKRLAASVAVCARNNGFSKKQCEKATRAAVRGYRESVIEASELDPLTLFYYRFDSAAVLKRIERHGKRHGAWKKSVVEKAARKTSLRAFRKLTDVVDGRRVIVLDPPRIVGIEKDARGDNAERFFAAYRASLPMDRRVLLERFEVVDVARKVVGVGSVGTRCLIVLLQAGDGTPLFLQFKQAVQSVLEPHLGASAFEQAGQRVVEGQQLIQATSDMFLGWSRWAADDDPKVDFYFRQLWDGKGKIDVEALSPKRLAAYASICGKTLAYGHARSGDAMTIRGSIGDDETLDDVIVAFSERYAERTARDHAQLVAAIADESIEAVRDL